MSTDEAKKRTTCRTEVSGKGPGQHWEIDFTEVRPGKYGYWYLLVLVDTFSGWVEAFPTKKKTRDDSGKKKIDLLL